MLQKINRLTKKTDFDQVFKRGKTVKTNFLLFYAFTTKEKASRFGFVVSKKISTKANERNAIKRRLRQATLGQLKNLKKPMDVIVIALRGIKEKKFSQIQEEVAIFFKKI